MEYMKTLPDNAFDLAVVDPPYGDGCSQDVQVERERERGRASGIGSEDGSTDTKWNRFGQRFDKYKNLTGGGGHGKDKYHVGQEELGQKSTGKK
jgi:DNA modification methylase